MTPCAIFSRNEMTGPGYTPKSILNTEKTQIGISMRTPASLIPPLPLLSVPFIGKNARILTFSVYIAHRKAEIMSPAMPTSPTVCPLEIPAVRSFHFEINPQKSGIPVRDRADSVYSVNVTGIFRPIPLISYIYSLPVTCMNAPAHRKRTILIMLWNSICVRPPRSPSGVMSRMPKSM